MDASSMGPASCRAGTASGTATFVADDRERLIERHDALVGEVLADEFEFLLVEQRGLHRDGILRRRSAA